MFSLVRAAVLAGLIFQAADPVSAGPVAWGTGNSGQTNVPSGLTDVIAVATGQANCLALTRDGRVTVWGDNSVGQTNVPPDLTNAIAIAAQSQQSLAVRSSGAVLRWGINVLPPADLTNATLVTAGIGDALALRRNGTLTCWGNNSHGETVVPPAATNIVSIASGPYHNLALRCDGTVFAWGDNSAGQCNVPAPVSNVVAIAAGAFHSLALKRDGSLAAWGDNAYGECTIPAGLSNVVAISGSSYASLALKSDGTVSGWGDNYYGQISIPPGLTNVVQVAPGVANFSLALVGEGPPTVTAQPLGLTSYSGVPLELQCRAAGAAPLSYQWRFNEVEIPGATDAFLFLDRASTSNSGDYVVQVSNGLGSTNSAIAHITVIDSAPNLLNSLANQTAYPGKAISFQISSVGSAPLFYQWQLNGTGIPGATTSALSFGARPDSGGQYSVVVSNEFGTATNACTLRVALAVQWAAQDFLPIMYSPGVTDLVSVITGIPFQIQHDTGIRRDGTGTNWNATGSPPGGLPAGFTNVIAVAVGVEHFLGLRNDGTMFAWGGNSYGEGTIPGGLDNVVAIAAGNLFSVALRSDGTVAAWGENSAGQCNVPIGLSNVTAIAAGQSHVLAAKEDGTVVAWGDNMYGQVSGATAVSNAIAVEARVNTSAALKGDGTIIEWPPTTPPIAPPGLANVAQVVLGHTALYALKNDGTVAAFSFTNPTNLPPPGLTNVAAISGCAGQPRASALTGYIAPFLCQVPLSRTVAGGETLTLRTRAIGSFPLSYQWRHDGADIPGATGSSLKLASVQAAQVGAYTVVVSNAFGTTVSPIAMLVMTPLLSQPALSGRTFSVRVRTLSSRTYIFESADSLIGSAWAPLLQFIGEGTDQLLTDTNAAAPARFYRVRQVTPPCSARPANLVSWWRAENDATDSAGTNHGMLAGNATFAAAAVARGFALDGTNDGIQLGVPGSLKLQDFTIEAWVKRADVTATTATGESGGSVFGWDTGGYGFGIYNDGRLNLSKIGFSAVNTGAILVDTAWHHVAVTKSGSAITFYLDGTVFPVSGYDPGFTFSGSAGIGARGDLSHSFLGRIDEVSIYSRGLSPGEIQAIYQSGSTGKCLP